MVAVLEGGAFALNSRLGLIQYRGLCGESSPLLLFKCIQWNPDFSNLQGKRNLVREIGSSRNRRWHQIMPNWPGIV